jgi:hypothetical protein
MKTLFFAITLIATLAQAEIVHYDNKGKEQPQTSKPNYPSSDLYTK